MRIIVLLFVTFTALFAKLNVSVAYPYIEQLTKEVAGDKVNVALKRAVGAAKKRADKLGK